MNQTIIIKLNNLLELGIKYNCPKLVKAIKQKYERFRCTTNITGLD